MLSIDTTRAERDKSAFVAILQEGIVSHNLRIKPIPTGERSLQGQMLHKIYEVKETDERFANLGKQFLSTFVRALY